MTIRWGRLSLAGWVVAVSTTVALGAAPPVQAPAPGTAATEKALVDRYCVTCHNERLKTGGLVLETLDLANVPAEGETWEKVIKKLRMGLMPPPGRPRPDKAAYDSFATYLESTLDRDAGIHPNPGRTEPFHRLNRTEYQNAVRDLLGVDIDVSAALPGDPASYGFDNMGGSLKMSPTLMDRYLALAQKVSRMAVGTPPPVPTFDYYRVSDDLPQDIHVAGLPEGTRGGSSVSYFFPMDGEYQIAARLAPSRNNNNLPAYPTEQLLEISIDGVQLKVFTLPGVERNNIRDAAGNALPNSRENLDADWQVRVPVKAGQHEVVATFLNLVGILDDSNLREPFQKMYISREAQAARLRSVEISGPYNAAGAGETPGRSHIFSCHPGQGSEELTCARTIFASLARRAYRRPATESDVETLMGFYKDGRTEGGFEGGIEAGVKRLLVSPEFLFRIERDPKGVAKDGVYRVTDLELASRLSFFLWSSLPDDELVTVASQGRLKDPKVLERQVHRMLADPKAQEFVNNFAGQWLFLRNVPATSPDLITFPNYDESLRQAMRRETELFFDSIVKEDRPVLDLLTARYTFVNERLAKHYGIPNIVGNDFQRITLPADSPRSGLLGQASILTVTSYPNRTSPVRRGAWLLENILGSTPPDPPPNVPALKDDAAGTKPKTLRERMNAHHRNPVCASCHSMIEPLGLALEHFDATGKYRDVGEGFSEIDATGNMPNGTPFDGAQGLAQAVVSQGDRFAATVTEKMLTYALGRGLESYDAAAVRTIVRNGARTHHRFASDLVMGVVKSVPFQMRKASADATTAVAAR